MFSVDRGSVHLNNINTDHVKKNQTLPTSLTAEHSEWLKHHTGWGRKTTDSALGKCHSEDGPRAKRDVCEYNSQLTAEI